MKKPGEKWHSLGVRKDKFEKLKALSDRRGLSIAFILDELLENHFRSQP